MKGPSTHELLLMAINELENAANNFREIARASKSAAQMLEQRVAILNTRMPPEPVEEPPDAKV